MDIIYISANSLLYDLRVTASLVKEHTQTLCSTPELEAAHDIVADIIRRIEDASTWAFSPSAPCCASEARMESFDVPAADDSGGSGGGSGPSGTVRS